MLNKHFPLICLNLFILLTVASCSGPVPSPIITKDSNVARTKAIVVMGVHWVEEYNDVKEGVMKIHNSSDLLLDQEKIRDERISLKESRLRNPLYYIANTRFIFQNSAEEEQMITRFNRDLKEYEPIAIHEVLPGDLYWKQIKLDSYLFNEDNSKELPILRDLQYKEISTPFHKWQLEPGKIYYLGDVTLHFQTKRSLYGLFTEKQVVRKLVVTKVQVEDRFQLVQEILAKQQAWFPVGEMQNLSFTKEWDYSARAIYKSKAPQQEKKKQVDKKKFFF